MGMTGRPQARAASFQLVVTADVLELQHGHGAVIADVAVSSLIDTIYSSIGHNRYSSWYVMI